MKRPQTTFHAHTIEGIPSY